MLCYAMLCYAVLCYAMPCHAMLCLGEPWPVSGEPPGMVPVAWLLKTQSMPGEPSGLNLEQVVVPVLFNADEESLVVKSVAGRRVPRRSG